MNEPGPGFFARFFLAFRFYFCFLFNRKFAAEVLAIAKNDSTNDSTNEAVETGAIEATNEVSPAALVDVQPDSALQLLGLLQQEGRFVDFIEENVTQYSDAEIGAAVRVVHEGCRKALRDHLSTEPVRSEPEGTRVTLPEGFDASAIRLTGNVVGQAPFNGTLIHRGWRVKEIKLPKLTKGHDVNILAPAEVEL